jgi:Derlin-2/3
VRAAYLPYCIVLIMLMFGSSLKYDIIGIIAGHLYYYLEDVVPKLPETEDFKLLKAPKVLVQICEYL